MLACSICDAGEPNRDRPREAIARNLLSTRKKDHCSMPECNTWPSGAMQFPNSSFLDILQRFKSSG